MTDEQLANLIQHVDSWGQLLLYTLEVGLGFLCILVGFLVGGGNDD